MYLGIETLLLTTRFFSQKFQVVKKLQDFRDTLTLYPKFQYYIITYRYGEIVTMLSVPERGESVFHIWCSL